MNDHWDLVAREARAFAEDLRDRPLADPVDAARIREHLCETFGNFESGRPLAEVLGEVSGLMRRWNVQTTHPRYFGLFNPSVLPAAAAGEALTAAWNSQLAVWSHAPAANEIERHTLRYFLGRFGFDPDTSIGSFTTGGAEANLSAVLTALARHCPAWAEQGLAALPGPVGIYVSAESHDSLTKVARMTGLGRAVLRFIPVDGSFRMDPDALSARIARDRQRGRRPLMVVATAGTTGAGAIDPLQAVGRIARDEGAWFHVDAAWGGFAALVPGLSHLLDGVSSADSVTFDAHKGLSVPMGAGMFLCRHPDAVGRAFSVRANYMPGSVRDTVDPYLTSVQWSRRFIGMKVFAVLAELGGGGLASVLERQVGLGEELRGRLRAAGWRIVNDTALPLVCFTHPRIEAGGATVHEVERRILQTGRVWISSVRLGDPPFVALRACMTSCETRGEDLDVLVETLSECL